MKVRIPALILIAIILVVLACCCERNNTRVQKPQTIQHVAGATLRPTPAVYEYKRDGKTYLVFRTPNGLTVIEHKAP